MFLCLGCAEPECEGGGGSPQVQETQGGVAEMLSHVHHEGGQDSRCVGAEVVRGVAV